MGLMRHLTTRSKRPETPGFFSAITSTISTNINNTEINTKLPHNHTTNPKGRPQISLPTALLSTTNMLSYTAPSVASMRAATSSSTASSRISQHSSVGTSDIEEEDTSLSSTPSLIADDASSLASPSSPISPSRRTSTAGAYFAARVESTSPESMDPPSPSAGSMSTSADSTPAQTPALEHADPFTSSETSTMTSTFAPTLPRRAPSHSKREHVRLARRRSQRTSMRLSYDNAAAASHSDSTASSPHPFSQELEQLSEAVEELEFTDVDANRTSDDAEASEDAQVMSGLGLKKWQASEYVLEILELTSDRFDVEDSRWESVE